MAQLPETAAEYARDGAAPASPRRAVLLWGGLLVAALVACFVSLGLWQWGKYAAKTALQAELDGHGREAPIAMPHRVANADFLRLRRVELRGEFDAAHQILIDNRVDPATERAGYHVVTPLKLAGSEMRVLVNRGWVPAGPDRRTLPAADPPVGAVDLTGVAVVPPPKFFTLAAPAGPAWEPVWQNLDLARYAAAAPWPLQPVVVQLDPESPHGYLRNWPRPDERADRHLSYALQWFGFAASSVAIWLFLLLRRRP